MAMNKKEQAAYDQLVAQARINRALRWSDYRVERDMPVPETSGDYQNGWSFNVASGTVYPTWSGNSVHGTREEGEVVDAASRRMRGMNGSQNGIPQFSTKERALKALRRSLEIKFAMQLDGIDNR
ncbi:MULTISPECIES: hypothetical protein [Enterobacterales]|jgi:hypothetical protein|uniref:Phage protein n=5 Tax=Enterobacterales TaxID=91347 RepID=A0AAW9C5Y3_KLUCR|nr:MULTISPECIES: hypothetical protein [Enterobacterales]MDU1358306.1 hypothetical protein [Citrobacter freundii]QHW11393.1 Hypothetical protein [Enterobacter cloacae]KAF0860344.1 hypothetical protein Y888_06555 [Mixta calida B021323]MCA5535224.1 hypothetical protein [Klebsiella pneumoniae]MCJ4716263.1 hypothetical protein [Klebsiella pneumoniae]